MASTRVTWEQAAVPASAEVLSAESPWGVFMRRSEVDFAGLMGAGWGMKVSRAANDSRGGGCLNGARN